MLDNQIQKHLHNWDIKNIKEAKKIYYSTSSILNTKQLQKHLKICSESIDPKERHDKMLIFYQDVIKEDFLNYYCSMLTSLDVSIACICKFNLYDLSQQTSIKKQYKTKINENKKRKKVINKELLKGTIDRWQIYSFFNQYEIIKHKGNKYDERYFNNFEDINKEILEPNIFIDPLLYNYELLSELLNREYQYQIKYQIIEKVGADALHVYSIRDSFINNLEFSERAKRIIANKYALNEMDREYWLYYVLIELYKQRNDEKKNIKAITEISKLFGKGINYMKARYYDKKKIVDAHEGLTLEKIMMKQLIFTDVKKSLQKLNI